MHVQCTLFQKEKQSFTKLEWLALPLNWYWLMSVLSFNKQVHETNNLPQSQSSVWNTYRTWLCNVASQESKYGASVVSCRLVIDILKKSFSVLQYNFASVCLTCDDLMFESLLQLWDLNGSQGLFFWCWWNGWFHDFFSSLQGRHWSRIDFLGPDGSF